MLSDLKIPTATTKLTIGNHALMVVIGNNRPPLPKKSQSSHIFSSCILMKMKITFFDTLNVKNLRINLATVSDITNVKSF